MNVITQDTTTAGPQLGFHTLDSEVSVDALPVEGTLPPWLAGSLLRNGPALFEDRERSVRHWFDGQAMLHRFAIADGKVGLPQPLPADEGLRGDALGPDGAVASSRRTRAARSSSGR